MSNTPESEFDLEKLFLPAWAQEPASNKQYADYQGERGGGDRPRDGRGDRRGPRPPRRDGGAPRGDGARGGGGFGGPRRDQRGGGRPPGGPGGGGRGPRQDRGRGLRSDEPREQRPPPEVLPDIEVTLVPDEKGVDSLSRQIKMTGRAFPLFGIAQMILQKPERHTFTFKVKKNAEGKPVQGLFLCALDDTLWLSEDEAVEHVLRRHFGTFYQAEKTAAEPPKGKYTFVAQCGMSGTIFGPPNHHDYLNQVRKLHTERYARMPFEAYKARVRIVRDEEVVKKWVEEQSWKTEYVCLNMPEPLRLPTREAVEKHFRENHKESIIKPVENASLSGTAGMGLRSPGLSRLVRSVAQDQRRFPLQVATVLSQQFASRGLQFFKVNKTVTHVSVARPVYLDLEATPVSQGIRNIVNFINSNPKCTRRKLLSALAPAPAPTPAPIPVAAPAPAATATADGQPVAAPAPTAAPAAPEFTPEQTAVNADLHWLIHQGHVIEFATGILETAKKPVPRPPKPEAKPAATPAPAAATEAASPADAAPAATESAAVSETPVPAEAAGPEPAAAVESTEPVEPPAPAPESPTPAPAPDEPAHTPAS